MKARLSPTTARELLTPAQQEACAIVVDDMWNQKRRIIIRRYLLATCLALNDLYGLGDKRLPPVLDGISDIIEDYSSRSYTPKEGRSDSAASGEDLMALAMQAELDSRPKIHIKIGDFIK